MHQPDEILITCVPTAIGMTHCGGRRRPMNAYAIQDSLSMGCLLLKSPLAGIVSRRVEPSVYHSHDTHFLLPLTRPRRLGGKLQLIAPLTHLSQPAAESPVHRTLA